MSSTSVSSFYSRRSSNAAAAPSRTVMADVSAFRAYTPRDPGEKVYRRCRIYTQNRFEIGHITQEGLRSFTVQFYDPLFLRDASRQRTSLAGPGEVRRFIETQVPGAQINGW